MQHLKVVGAVVVHDGKVLVAQRSQAMKLPGLWEFPGGKIETGETPESALAREIREELGVLIAVGDHIETTTFQYEFALVELATFYAEITDGDLSPAEHSQLRWCDPRDLPALEWAPADLPAVHLVVANLTVV